VTEWLIPILTALGGGLITGLATALKYRRDAARADLAQSVAALAEARRLAALERAAREAVA
jgi:hypothetical protein